MDQQYQDKLLEKLNKLQGLRNAKKTIIQFAKYISLCQRDGIKGIGNSNVIIDCNEDYIDRKALIKLLLEILGTDDAYYLTKRELKNDICFNKISSDVVILDTIELQTTLQLDIADLKYRVNKNKEKTFIVVISNFDRKVLENLADDFSWYIETTISSIEDKQSYIIDTLKANSIKVSKNSNVVSDLSLESLPVIDTTLLNIIIDCKINNTDVIDNTVLNKYYQSVDDDLEQDVNIKSNTKSALQQLDNLIGLENVKKQIHQIVNYIKVNKSREKMPMLHMVFSGQAGTCKSSVARLVAQIFKEEHILSQSQFVEVSRADLIAGYVGQTALKTQEVINKAMGGVLFIDEAYSLSPRESSKDYGAECISTLIKAMEDNRDNLCVILAGYNDDMEQLLQSNRGLSSRIQFKLHFQDYTADELYEIFKKMVKDDNYKISGNIKPLLVEHFEQASQQENFGNRTLCKKCFRENKICAS